MRPSYWRPWTRYVPLPFLVVLLFAFFPLYLAAGAYDGCRKALQYWWSEVDDVWRAFWNQ
jgi:hypothetical protein